MSSSFSTWGDREKGKSPLVTVNDYEKLNYYQNCLDETLIDDILAAVNNDVGEALPLLEKMFISENHHDIIIGKGNKANYDYDSFDPQTAASLVGVPSTIEAADYYSPWADQDLIEDVLATYNNDVDVDVDVDVASSSIETRFNFEGKDKNIEELDSSEEEFESFGTQGIPSVEEEDEDDEEDSSFITNVDPSEYDEDYFYPWVDESLIEEILAGLNNDCNGNEFKSFDTDRSFIPDVLSEYQPNCFHSGANESLIEDIYSGVNSNVDVDVASSLIEAMLNLEIEDVGARKEDSIGNDFKFLDEGSASLPEKADMSSIMGGPSKYEVNYFDPWVVETLIEDILSGGNVDVASSIIEAMFNSVDKDIGIEKVDTNVNDFEPFGKQGTSLVEKTDGKEEGFYQLHRREALKVVRSAREHSEAAKDAHAKGDHVSARCHSRIANKEWIKAKKLNAEAAKAILAVKNRRHDLWILDLHGLHESEAVDALRQRLETVESLLQKSDFLASLVQSKNKTKKARPRQIRLRAITGWGKHSEGAAKLSPAVRKFLTEKGYGFDASQPGSFLIQPVRFPDSSSPHPHSGQQQQLRAGSSSRRAAAAASRAAGE